MMLDAGLVGGVSLRVADEGGEWGEGGGCGGAVPRGIGA